jgi:hypothetical protein
MSRPDIDRDTLEQLTGIFNQVNKIIDTSPEAQKFTAGLFDDIAAKWTNFHGTT